MILAMGIDAVEIARFTDWTTRPRKQLERIFTHEELEYCLSNRAKTPERLAARFAAKEAFYKALHIMLPDQKLPLFTVCKNVMVKKQTNGSPFLGINNEYFKDFSLRYSKLHLSITHTTTTAIAIILIEA